MRRWWWWWWSVVAACGAGAGARCSVKRSYARPAMSGTGRARLQLKVSSMSDKARGEARSATVGPQRSATDCSSASIETPQIDRIQTENATQVLLGHPPEDVPQGLTMHRRRALQVGVVRPPHELVDADLVAHLGLVTLHERAAHPDVLLEVVPGPHVAGRSAPGRRRGCRRTTPCPGSATAATAHRSRTRRRADQGGGRTRRRRS